MNKDEFKALGPGDIIRRKDNIEWAFIVSQNFGNRLIAVRTIEIKDPKQWEHVKRPDQMTVEEALEECKKWQLSDKELKELME